MVRIKVEYDAYNRTFKLVDRELASALEDGGIGISHAGMDAAGPGTAATEDALLHGGRAGQAAGGVDFARV